jgi:hypothetical protein
MVVSSFRVQGSGFRVQGLAVDYALNSIPQALYFTPANTADYAAFFGEAQ